MRWDSLGEFLALAVSLEDIGSKQNNAMATVFGNSLNDAVGKLLEENKSPQRKVKQLDNRGSHFYIGLYWSETLSKHPDLDDQARQSFEALSKKLKEGEEQIIGELTDIQGRPAEIGGYYRPKDDAANKVMRPSQTLNDILSQKL